VGSNYHLNTSILSRSDPTGQGLGGEESLRGFNANLSSGFDVLS
jgi:hypothetical protein